MSNVQPNSLFKLVCFVHIGNANQRILLPVLTIYSTTIIIWHVIVMSILSASSRSATTCHC